MEIVDLSIEDPEIKIKNDKKVRKKFNELKKYVPFLKYIFELDPVTHSKYKILIDWIKIKNHSNLDYWHVISCESTIRRRYEKLKNTLNFPTHIAEIFEGAISIVISDEDDSASPSKSTIFKNKEHLSNDHEQYNKNSIAKQESSTSSNKIVHRLEANEKQTESRKKDETLPTRELSLSVKRKNKCQTNSLAKTSSESKSNKYWKDSSIEKKENNTIKVDASVFDIVSWSDLEKEDEKDVRKVLSPKGPPRRASPLLPESDRRKKKKYKDSPKKTKKNSQEIEHKSYESLIKQKKEIIRMLKDDDKKNRPSNSADNCKDLEKPNEIELFQRRESTRSERKKSLVDPSIIDSVKCVLNKNPDVIAEVVNDSLGTKIVYDYTNVTIMSTSKTMINKPESNNSQLETEISESKVVDSTITRNVNIISSKKPEKNYCTAGDAYRKAMHEQQSNPQFQESMQWPLLLQQNKINHNSSVNSKSSKTQNYYANPHSKQDSSNNNKKSHQSTDATQPRLPNSNSSSRKQVDHGLTSEQTKNKQLKPKSNGFDINIKTLSSSEARGKSTERKTNQTNCIETFGTFSNSSESEQKQKRDHDEVVLMSFPDRRKVIHRIESESSLEDFVPEQINFVSSSIEKVKCNVFPINNKTDETSNQSCSSSKSLKNTLKKLKDSNSKSSKTKLNSVSDLKEIKMPILFKKDEPRKSSEHKTIKTKHESVSKKLESASVSSKIDQKLKKSKNVLNKDPMIDLKLKENRAKSEPKKISDKTQKRKSIGNHQEHDCSKQKQLKVDNVFKKKSDGSNIEKNAEKQAIRNKNKKSTDKTIKINDNSYTNQVDLKRKNSIESTKKTNKCSEEKEQMVTQPVKELILTPKKNTNSSAAGSKLKVNSNLDINIGDESKQRQAKTKDSSYNSSHKLNINSHTIQKCAKRKTSIESTTEINNQPVKKSKISTKPNKIPTPKKTANSPSRRFYRELNNLTCTFKESLLPKTIGRRRCSSSWLNLSENVNQESKNINSDLTSAPIQRRRQTCSAMPNLKLTLQRSSEHNDEYYIKCFGNEKSSDETDEFDIDEHRSRNKEISNPDISEREASNTNNSTSTIESPNKEMPRLIPFDSIPIPTISKSLGNNDSKMTFKSTKTCVLCNKNSNDLTNHYVVKHKTESYVSRLSSADIYSIEKEKSVAIPVCRNRYRITCVFCKQMIEDHFENFYAHFSYHTGEYNFQCEGCKIRKPYKEDIGSHQLRSRVCRNSKIVKVHHYELETTVIYLYICTICNFVNLNELNLQNHIQKQHGFMSNELENSKKCILLVKDIRDVVEDIHPPGLEGNNCETDATPVEEEAPLCAEQDFICELPMDIQNILIDEDYLAKGQELPDKSKVNSSKAIIKQKCDIRIQPDHDKAIATSPEALLEEMHALNNENNTTARNILGESANLYGEGNSIKKVPAMCTKEKISSNNDTTLFDELKDSETQPKINTIAPSSKKLKLNRKLDVEKQNNSEFIASIEAYIQNTNKIQSPKPRNIDDCEFTKFFLSREDHCNSPAERNLEIIPDSKSSSEKLNQSIDNSFEDMESITSIEKYINSTNKINFQSSSKESRNSPAKINSEKLPLSNSSEQELSQSTEKHFEDPHDSESLTSIEAYIKSTNEILCQNSESRIEERHNLKTSLTIHNNSSGNLSKSLEKDLEKQYSRHSMIYRQYDKLDLNNFGLFKCLMEDCLYSTNSDGEFEMHCLNHSQTNNIFDCPYCFTKSSCLENCIHHIWLEHSMSNYQCIKCSYRSIVPGNVIIHRRVCHKDTTTDQLESMYKCSYLKISEGSKYKAMPKKIRDNIHHVKCPDCSCQFFSTASIISHIKNSQHLTFQRFSSLKLNELACIHCKEESNCKEMMQIHLALQHPDEPSFIIERKVELKDCEDPVEGFMVVDISIDVVETDIKIIEESESHKTVYSNEDQEALDTLETEPTEQLEAVTNIQASSISTDMSLESPTKSCRLPDNCTISHQPGQKSEENFSNSQTKSLLVENKNSSMKLKNMVETLQIEEDCSTILSGSIINSITCEPQQNYQSKTLEDIEKIGNLDIYPIITQVPDHLQIQSPNESYEPVQPNFIDNDEQVQIENKRLEDHFETTTNFNEAIMKEGKRIKLLLDLLVENTGVHGSTLYGCPHCNSSFMHFELWLTHIENKHTSIEDMHCPYCTKQLQLDSAESHFREHLRHEYICYYCIASCCSKKKMQEHFASFHENCDTIELPIASFYLVIKQDAIVSDYTALFEHFGESIYLHLIKKIQQNNEWTARLTDSCLDEMEIPQYKPEGGHTLFKCFVKQCPFVASDENSFDDHLAQHELPKTFECTYCMFLIAYPSWESIKCHHLQHLSPMLHICCVCKFVHYNNEGIIKHIENLHNSRDVPVLCLLRDGLKFKVSLSIFLPVNKISFTTSKACFCCAQELSNSNKYIYHLKNVHKLSLCPKCQICGKIILTHLDGEAHYKEYHQMESFKLKYDVLTTYLNDMIITSRSPLALEIRFKNKKGSEQQIELNHNDSSSVAVREEILVKDELEEDKQTESISIKCIHKNQLLENRSGNTFQQHPHQSDGSHPSPIQQLQTMFGNRDAQNFTGCMGIGNTSVQSDLQIAEPSTQHQQIVNRRKTTSSQQHVQPLTNPSSQEQTIAKQVPLPSQTAVPHPTSATATATQSSLPSTSYLHSLLSSQSQNKAITETAPPNCSLSILEQDSLPTNTQHVVLKEIQLSTGNAILSIPLEASTIEQQPGIVEESQRIPVITTRVAQPNIQQLVMPPASIPLSTQTQMYTGPVFNTSIQVNNSNLDELAPICGTCNLECIDFMHLKTHYESTHATYNQGFYFYVDRKIGCMYCHFQGVLSSFAQHHATFHPDRAKLCHSVIDPIRCGICNDIFRYSPSSSANSYALPPLCACPGYQRVLADCLNLPILKTLQDFGYQYYKYSCDACGLSFQFPQQFVHHYVSVHHQYIDPQVWRTKLKYYCCLCPSMVSFNIRDVIFHMRFSHLIALSLPLFQRFEFYKRIRIAHPNGFLVSLGDLRNTGQFDEEIFKQKINNFEAQYLV